MMTFEYFQLDGKSIVTLLYGSRPSLMAEDRKTAAGASVGEVTLTFLPSSCHWAAGRGLYQLLRGSAKTRKISGRSVTGIWYMYCIVPYHTIQYNTGIVQYRTDEKSYTDETNYGRYVCSNIM